MSIVVTCATCGKKLKAPDSAEGKRAPCPSCRAEILITGAQPAPKAEVADTHQADRSGERKLKLLQLEGYGNIGIVRFGTSRVLDGSNVEQLGKEFDYLIQEKYVTQMVLNFERVRYMSSAVLGKLIALNKMVLAEKGKLRVCGIDPSVYEIFKIMKLDRLFKIYDTEEEAVESFGRWLG